MVADISIPYDQIADFCHRHHICTLSLFGSALREDFRPDSDIDLLAAFEAGHEPTLTDLLSMEKELQAMFRRDVDFGDMESIAEDPNYIRRKRILSSAQVIYER